MTGTPCEVPDWLDHRKLDAFLPAMLDLQDPELRTALLAAFERGDAELVVHDDAQGEWIGVRALGMRVGRVHRSRVQKSGAN